MVQFADFEKKIKVNFKSKGLLRQAFIHRSYINENPSWDVDHNERLEFLGDAVLELVVTEYLYRNYPNPEGEMTNWRAALVNATILAGISSEFKLNDYLMLSRGESKDTGRARHYILANAMEALIGAIYLDGGYEPAKVFIDKFIITKLPEIIKDGTYRDSKSMFQEESQDRIGITPAYNVLEEWGPDHARNFRVGVFLGSEMIASGEGPSKQEAQQQAAQAALRAKGWE